MAEYMDLPAYRALVDECRKTGDMAPLRQMNGWLAEVDALVAERKTTELSDTHELPRWLRIEREYGWQRTCDHTADEAHANEATMWAEEWAKRIRTEAPPGTTDEQAWLDYENHALDAKAAEILESRPPHLRGCSIATLYSVCCWLDVKRRTQTVAEQA